MKDNLIQDKYEKLIENLTSLKRLAVAFSGGVDSTFLLKAARQALGGNLLAITAKSPLFPANELMETKSFCRKEGIRHIVLDFDPFAIDGFVSNPPDRCYHCKKNLFTAFLEICSKEGFPSLAEGSNMDDLGDYRPGMKAVSELGILSPLKEAELKKEEIRLLSEMLGLKSGRKASFACLASRFEYGQTIDRERLAMVEKGEDYLRRLGFWQFRVRLHGRLARIEVPAEDFDRVFAHREDIYETFKRIGFSYVSMDLAGYRTGSMNEVITNEGGISIS